MSAHCTVYSSEELAGAIDQFVFIKQGRKLQDAQAEKLTRLPVEKFTINPISSRASLTVRFTVKSGDPPGAGKIWENRFCTEKMDQQD